MINIDFCREGGKISLKMQGHAGYISATGGDIVCAAVSGIFYALLGFLSSERSGLRVGKLAPGDVDISCSEEYGSAMKQAYIGFLQMATTYPGTAEVCESVWNIMTPNRNRQ